jgi:hypothetical protein
VLEAVLRLAAGIAHALDGAEFMQVDVGRKILLLDRFIPEKIRA